MIVDCHTHIKFDADSSILCKHLESAQPVDKTIVLADFNGPHKKINEQLSEYTGKHADKLVGFAIIDPVEDNIGVKSLSSLTDKGLGGVVLYCPACGFHPAHSRAMRFYESAEQLGLPVFFHNSGHLSSEAILDYARPFLLDEVARNFGELKIIIGSMGIPFVEQTLSMISKHKNVYADLTVKPANIWQIYNIVLSVYERGLMDKLLFGSGFPASSANECIETLLGFNKLLADTNLPTVPRGSIRNIIERNTLELLGIKNNIAEKDTEHK